MPKFTKTAIMQSFNESLAEFSVSTYYFHKMIFHPCSL